MSERIGPYLKTLESVIGVVLIVGGMSMGMAGHLPPWLVTTIGSVLGVLTAVKVWLIRNESLIKDAADAVEDLVEGVDTGRHRKTP